MNPLAYLAELTFGKKPSPSVPHPTKTWGEQVRDATSRFTIQSPPGQSRGILPWLRQAVGGWIGPEKSAAYDAGKYVVAEKVAGGPRGVKLPAFLPFIDEKTGETEQMRLYYRMMMRDPIIKAALLGKTLDVASLDLHVNPMEGGNSRDRACARFTNWNLNQRVTGRAPRLAMDICLPGLIDGYSLCEKAWQHQETGKYRGSYVLDKLKGKDVDNDVVLIVDEYRNVTGILGLRYNAGYVFSPADFALFRYLPIFDYPGGQSDLRACYDDQTEVLTKDGWKKFPDLTEADTVAALENGRLVYQKPTDYISYHYSGKMFRQNSMHVDVCVTPNHRMWVAPRGSGRFQFTEAESLMDGSFPKIVLYKRDAEWDGQEEKEFTLPGIEWQMRQANQFGKYGITTRKIEPKTMPMDDWLRFLGFYLAEGWCHRRKQGNRQCAVCVAQNPGEDLEQMKQILDRLGFAYCVQESEKPGKRCVTLRISNLQLWTYLHKLGGSYTKQVPSEFKGLSSRQLGILLEWMMKGDGRHGGTQYCTVSKKLANDTSELFLKCGFAPCIYSEKMPHGIIWIVAANTKGIGGTEVNRTIDERSWEEYDGPVHCVTVPAGIIYVRRNGKSYWCGNCYAEYWMYDTVRKLRMICLEKRSMPILKGTYRDMAQRPSLETILQRIRWDNWIAAPEWAKIEAIETAGQAVDMYQKALEDLKQNIFIGIQGAFLQALEGSNPSARGNSLVQKSTSDLFKWYLMTLFLSVLNEQVIPDIADLNYAGLSGYPEAIMGGIDEGSLGTMLNVDKGLQELGLTLSRKALYRKYGREEPSDPKDVLGMPAAPSGATPGGGQDQPRLGYDGASLQEMDDQPGGSPPTALVDLDGTLAEYEGWEGPEQIGEMRADTASGLDGRQLVAKLKAMGYRVVVFTSREELSFVEDWLRENGIDVDGVTNRKEPAQLYIDDRAVNALADWNKILQRAEQVKGEKLAEKARKHQRDGGRTNTAVNDVVPAPGHTGGDGYEEGSSWEDRVVQGAAERLLTAAGRD